MPVITEYNRVRSGNLCVEKAKSYYQKAKVSLSNEEASLNYEESLHAYDYAMTIFMAYRDMQEEGSLERIKAVKRLKEIKNAKNEVVKDYANLKKLM